MKNVLIIYGTDEGQTEKIAKYMASIVESNGYITTLMHGRALPHHLSLLTYTGIIIGASIHIGQHQVYIRDFVKKHVRVLEQMPSVFYSVSLTATEDTPEAKEQMKAYLAAFTKETGWHPMQVGVFGGALRYSKYDFIKRMIVKAISYQAGRPTDTSQDYEYTDWVAVNRFVQEFLVALQPDSALESIQFSGTH